MKVCNITYCSVDSCSRRQDCKAFQCNNCPWAVESQHLNFAPSVSISRCMEVGATQQQPQHPLFIALLHLWKVITILKVEDFYFTFHKKSLQRDSYCIYGKLRVMLVEASGYCVCGKCITFVGLLNIIHLLFYTLKASDF